MKEDTNRYLDQTTFCKDVIPFFEKIRLELLELLNNKKQWKDVFLPYRLAFLNNSKTEGKIHFYFTSEISDHTYSYDINPSAHNVGLSTSTWFSVENAHSTIVDMLRSIFVHSLIRFANIVDIFQYFRRLLKSNYSEVGEEETPEYLRLYVYHLKIQEGLFAISGYRKNFVFPLQDELNASVIDDITAENEKIIITNKDNTNSYKGFDSILGPEGLCGHFSLFHFKKDIQLYRDILKLDYSRLISILDLLGTSSDYNIYNMKKELINMGASKGNVFESYLDRFLKHCFEKCYQDMTIKRQVPNRGRTRIRDFIIINHNSTNEFLKSLERRGVELILFDAKNYSKNLASRDIDTFTTYIQNNSHFGKMGIILSRHGVNEKCNDTICTMARSEHKIVVLVLNQDDLLKMLDYLDGVRSPIDVIRDKYYELILKI